MTAQRAFPAPPALPRRLSIAAARRATPAAKRAAVLALVALSACAPEIQGSGVFRDERRNVPAFVGIKVDDPIITAVDIGPEQRVEVSGDANVVMQLAAEVYLDPVRQLPVLELRVTDDFVPVHPLRVDVTIPDLRLIQAQNKATVSVDGIEADALEVRASDGASVRLAGKGGASLEVFLSGAVRPGASIDASHYAVKDARVALTGGSTAELLASVAVVGTATPGCTVENLGPGLCQVTDGLGQPVSCAPR